MPDFRQSREREWLTQPVLNYQSDPSYTPLDQIGNPGMGGAGNEGGVQQAHAELLDRFTGGLDRSEQLGQQSRGLMDALQANHEAQRSQGSGLDLGGVWQGIKDAGSKGMDLLGQGINAITPSQEGYDNFAMRLQRAGAIANNQIPLYMREQQQQMEMANQQDMMQMKRQQLADYLQQQAFAKQQKDEEHALGIWKDHQMPVAMKKKLSQQLAAKGNVLAGNLARLGDEQLVAEMDTLQAFLPKGKMEELSQMMTQPNADLDHVEQWVNHAREKKKVAGEQRMKSERFAELHQRHSTEGLDPMSPEFDEFKQMVMDREKRHNEAAELNMKLRQMGLTTKKTEQELAEAAVMPKYGPEVHTAGGKVERDKLDPQTGQLTKVIGEKPPASVVNLDMRQESAFEKKLGDKNAERVDDTRVKAQDSAAIIQNIHEGRKLLDSGMITGVGAEYLTTFGQALQQIGFSKDRDAIKNTQAYGALMASNVAKHIKEFGAGTGLSDADREYAKKMAGGEINLDEKSIRKILDLNEQMSRTLIQKHNKSVKGIKSVIPLTVEEPGQYESPKKRASSDGKRSLDDLLKKYGGQ